MTAIHRLALAATETDERPRERLLRYGAAALTNAELLAIMLRTGTARQSALALGHALLARFGGVRALLAAQPTELFEMVGLGQAKVCQLLAVHELTRRALQESLTRGAALAQPEQVKQYCATHLLNSEVERCVALYLDSSLHLIVAEEVARGTLSHATVYLRELVRTALRHHAAALILAHNHPSGCHDPSPEDYTLTRNVRDALKLVDVRLVDHLIIAGNQVVSFAELGEI